LTNIAGCYQFLRRYDEAIPLYRRALEIYEDLLGPIHADVAVTTNDLAVLYFTTGNTDQAEKLYKKALHVYEKIFGPHHPDVGQVARLRAAPKSPSPFICSFDWLFCALGGSPSVLSFFESCCILRFMLF
jgi:tetratricopeptide (TPR) repeat protein